MPPFNLITNHSFLVVLFVKLTRFAIERLIQLLNIRLVVQLVFDEHLLLVDVGGEQRPYIDGLHHAEDRQCRHQCDSDLKSARHINKTIINTVKLGRVFERL